MKIHCPAHVDTIPLLEVTMPIYADHYADVKLGLDRRETALKKREAAFGRCSFNGCTERLAIYCDEHDRTMHEAVERLSELMRP